MTDGAGGEDDDGEGDGVGDGFDGLGDGLWLAGGDAVGLLVRCGGLVLAGLLT